MKFGACINWRGATIDFTRSIAREADNYGFEYLWLTEAWGLEAISTAGYLLGITERVKIGVGVVNIYSRIRRANRYGMCHTRPDCSR